MAINLLSDTPLEENEALFENDQEQGHDEGSITWHSPTQEGDEWFVSFSGIDVVGGTIEETEVQITENETLNPTKVFWALVRVAREILCPSCIT